MICNKTRLTFAMFCPLLLLSPVKAAKNLDECQKNTGEKTSSASMSRCLDEVISYLDRDLQTWVNLHTFNLEEKAMVSGRPSALKMFKRSQSNFITYRENECRWRYLAISPARGADLAYKNCYAMLSQSRITALSKIDTSNATQ
ncbi:MAG: DUF1311 domain-containing protein [Colwellia sp.]|nr:DUF1311 domain-containing protein [Colwellia sp.]